jgi:hypothetical protein
MGYKHLFVHKLRLDDQGHSDGGEPRLIPRLVRQSGEGRQYANKKGIYFLLFT